MRRRTPLVCKPAGSRIDLFGVDPAKLARNIRRVGLLGTRFTIQALESKKPPNLVVF